MDNFYVGDEIKFALNIEAEGFSMDDDDFDVEVLSSSHGSASASKGDVPNSESRLIIFKESNGTSSDSDSSDSDSSDSDSSDSSSSENQPGQWFAIVDTTDFQPGRLRVVATAYVPDANANDGVRRMSSVQNLVQLRAK